MALMEIKEASAAGRGALSSGWKTLIEIMSIVPNLPGQGSSEKRAD
jgi:hypothetical protein